MVGRYFYSANYKTNGSSSYAIKWLNFTKHLPSNYAHDSYRPVELSLSPDGPARWATTRNVYCQLMLIECREKFWLAQNFRYLRANKLEQQQGQLSPFSLEIDFAGLLSIALVLANPVPLASLAPKSTRRPEHARTGSLKWRLPGRRSWLFGGA